MIKPHLLFLLSLAIFTLLAKQMNASEDPQLSVILNKHIEAMGGIYNWDKVESIRLCGTIERDGQTAEIVIIKKRPNQIRATVTVPIPNRDDEYFQAIRAHDGKTAWTGTRLAGAPNLIKEELPAEAAAQLLTDAGVLPPLIKFWRGGEKLDLLSPQTIDGVTNFRIRATGKDLPCDYTFYVSSDSFLLTRYESIDPKHGITQTALGGYTKAHGILIPTQSITQTAETGQSLIQTDSIEIGVGIYKEYFEVGESIGTAEL
jgi:hypothetical protein